MMEENNSFSYSIQAIDQIHRFELKGRLLEKFQAKKLLTELEKFLRNNQNKIIINLSKLEYVNSEGLTVLISILTRCRKSGGEVVIDGVSEKINQLLIISKLNHVFVMVENTNEALEKLK